jgi:hypothetical protein
MGVSGAAGDAAHGNTYLGGWAGKGRGNRCETLSGKPPAVGDGSSTELNMDTATNDQIGFSR